MKRFWVSWYTAFENPEREPPFPYWYTGQTFDGALFTVCALVDAPGDRIAFSEVRRFFEDAEERFCDEKESGWLPKSDRFPIGEDWVSK